MSTFEDEMKEGFAELAGEAGPADLSFNGTVLACVIDGDMEQRMRADLKLGPGPRLSTVEIARALIVALGVAPAVNDYFDLGTSFRLRIEEVRDDDPTNPTIVYVVKKRPVS